MKHSINWFEIPAADFERATTFYEAIFAASFKREVINGFPNAFFPYEQPGVGGSVVAGEGYVPGVAGPLVYLNTAGAMSTVLDRVPKAGGQVVMPRTDIGMGIGHMAIIIDSEGNRIGLHE
ncbi:MAG TPA: hypothetical protein PLQ56_08420 [Aggregatilineales bacterium]|nr:VOC family protein [Anaerolineae bacterium]HUN06612.1 hypothetical protein [Aggregatilineales bacterium]